RPQATGQELIDVLIGEIAQVETLADLPLSGAGRPDTGPPGRDGARHDVLALIPYRQIRERGFTCVDDGAPLLAMTVTAQETVPAAEALSRIPDLPIAVS